MYEDGEASHSLKYIQPKVIKYFHITFVYTNIFSAFKVQIKSKLSIEIISYDRL